MNRIASPLVLLLVATASQVNAQIVTGYPQLPAPEPLNLPDCPLVLMGIANDVYYYGTKNCEFGGSGYGQTNSAVSMLGCRTDDPTKCKNPIRPLVRVAKTGCDPATTTLSEAINQCQARLAYLDKLLTSNEIDGRNKGRIRSWRGHVSGVLNYLQHSGQPDDVKVQNFCNDFVPKDQDHDEHWSHSVLLLARKKQVIGDETQPSLPPKDNVRFDPIGSGATPVMGPILKVEVNDREGGDLVVFFQTIVVNDGRDHFRIGLEVAPAGVTKDGTARFIDRHRHGHLIQATSGPTNGVWYLVSSFNNLEIKH